MFCIIFIKSFLLIIVIKLIYLVDQNREIRLESRTRLKNISSLSYPNDEYERPQIVISMNSASLIDLDSHPNLKLLPNISDENEFLLCLENLENPKYFARIVGGYGMVSNLGDFPFLALLQYKNVTKVVTRCAGTLISKNYVLTAAHCIKPNLYGVRLGEYNLITEIDCDKDYCLDPVQDIPIEKIVVHNYNSKTKLNDIALIRLKRSANITANNVKPISLPTTDILRSKSSVLALVAGWGETEKGILPEVILKVQVVVNKKRLECQNNYKKLFNIDITDEYICAYGVHKYDTCRGDSGGPLLFDVTEDDCYVQYGIVSAGPSVICGTQYDIGGALYVNVSHYMKWILDNLEP